MKKRQIKSILKQFDAIPLPEKEKILTACPHPNSVEKDVPASNPKAFRRKTILPICIAFTFLICIVSSYFVVAEAKEYKEAISFFQEYNLSTKGLSRGDIKKVYRDITTGTFSYDKTSDIITDKVSGFEIAQEEPSPEDLKHIWAYYKSIDYNRETSDTSYDCSYNNNSNDTVQCTFSKYIGGKKDWSICFDGFYLQSYIISKKGILVYGSNDTNSSDEKEYPWIILLDFEGNILWEKQEKDNSYHSEYITYVLVNEDNIVTFSDGDFKDVCIAVYDYNGKRNSFSQKSSDGFVVSNAAFIEDGYLAKLCDYEKGEKIAKIDYEGNIIDEYKYSSGNKFYTIEDMIEYNGKIYLSAYVTPASLQGTSSNYHDEIASITDELLNHGISNEELTPKVRDIYTAVLLLCNNETGTPEKFYSVKGSLPGSLSINEEGDLKWEIESISDTYFSPTTSSFSIGGSSYVYEYSFNPKGKLIEKTKTNRIVPFRR